MLKNHVVTRLSIKIVKFISQACLCTRTQHRFLLSGDDSDVAIVGRRCPHSFDCC
jgi:hypothetical protein